MGNRHPMSNQNTPRPLNVGLVGGGSGAFIAGPHQRAVMMDGTRRIVAAALGANPQAALNEAKTWPFPLRGYGSYDDMIGANASLPDHEKLDYVVIVTPNWLHYDPAMKAMKAGIAVFCEKPLCMNLAEASELVTTARELNIPFAVSHTYLGHWTSQFCRFIVQSGLLGAVRWVDSHYNQGWLASRIEETGQQQASWRVDPKQAGGSGCGGDIGTHALMQLRYITGLEVTRVAAHLETFVEGRALDDHFTAYCQLSNGGKGLIRASQICIGKRNDLGITIAGSKGTLVWRQEESEQVSIYLQGQPDRTYWRGQVEANDGFLPVDVPAELLAGPTMPSGHHEGLHDAFARLHRGFEKDVRRWQHGQPQIAAGAEYATATDGWVGMAFIDACLASGKLDGQWQDVAAATAAF